MNKKLVIVLVIVAAIVLIYILNKKGYLNMFKPKRLLRYFELSEFDSTAIPSEIGKGTYVNSKGVNKLRYSGEKNMDKDFLFMLDEARDIIEKGWNTLNPSQRIVFSINSGYRTPQYNDTLDTVTNSPHTYGKAADVRWGGYNDAQKEAILEALHDVGFRRFGIANSYVHVDNADMETGHPTPAVWTYNTQNPIVSNIQQIAAIG